MKKKILLICVCTFMLNLVYGVNISGMITDKTNGQPVEYANVIIKETEQGGYSNFRGYFVITNVPSGSYTLFVSHVSFNVSEQRIKVGSDNLFLNIELNARSIQMEEMVVSSKSDKPSVNTREIVISHVSRTTKQLLDVVQVAEPDVFRSILTLPGVTPIADFSSGMYVRGGTPDQNQILLDHIEVYNPTHFGGLFSTFNTDAVNNVDLMKGGFPAKYGGRLSSVLEVQNRDGNRKHHQGVARLSLISLSATQEGPWKLGDESGSYMGSFRRSYLELMQKAIDIIPDYYFYDGHLKFNWDISDHDKVMVSTYFGYDQLNLGLGSAFGIDLGWGNRTITGQWVHIFNPQLFSHFVLGNSQFESNMTQKSGNNRFERINGINDLTMKGLFNYKPNNDHLFEFGFDSKYNTIEFLNKQNYGQSENRLPMIETESMINDIFVQDSWELGTLWTFQPGLRLSNYKTISINLQNSPDASYTRLSPRASIRRKLTVDSNVFFSWGRYYQFLLLISPGISTPLDVWFPLDGSVKPGEADHYILGYKHELMEGLGFDVEIYYKDMKNLVDYNWDTEATGFDSENGKLSDVIYVGVGDASGIDLLLRTDKWGWTGFIGYSFCITKKKLEGINVNPVTNRSEYYYPKYDRNHSINIVQAYNMTENVGKQVWGADVIFGLTFSLASGQPTAVPEQVYWAGDHFGFLYSYEDSKRLPYYSRLDLSYKMLWHKRKYSIEPYLQVINVLNRKNVFNRNYYIDENLSVKYEDSTQFPLIPFIGVNVNW